MTTPSPGRGNTAVEEEEEMEFLYDCGATAVVADVAAALASTGGI